MPPEHPEKIISHGEIHDLPVELQNFTWKWTNCFSQEFLTSVKVLIVSLHGMHVQDTDRANKLSYQRYVDRQKDIKSFRLY